MGHDAASRHLFCHVHGLHRGLLLLCTVSLCIQYIILLVPYMKVGMMEGWREGGKEYDGHLYSLKVHLQCYRKYSGGQNKVYIA